MSDFYSVLVSVAGGAALASIGFIVRRLITKAGDQEQATLLTSYAGLLSTLKDKGLTLDEVKNVGVLIKQREKQEAALEPPDPTRFPSYWTQSAMNVRAFGAANIAEARLEGAVAELQTLLDKQEIETLDKAQEYWSLYRDERVNLAGLAVSGGTMEPLIRESERETVTLQWTADIKIMIDERKNR